MQAQLTIIGHNPSTREILENKARIHRKVSDKYQLRTDAIVDAVNRLETLAVGKGLEFYRSDIKPVSNRAAKSTKYTIQCRIGTGDIVPTITFRDSMNGESCTFIDFGMYRKVCSNGLHLATSEHRIYKQNHLNQWQLDIAAIEQIFDEACSMVELTLNKYTAIRISEIEQHPRTMRNKLLERLATNGLITESQASTAQGARMYYYDASGDLFGIVNAVQEALTTNRNGSKKVTDANAQLNRKLLPALDVALKELYNIQLAA